MEDGEEQPANAFTQLFDKILPAAVAVAAWCPTMDLLAVAFVDGRVAVHRLNWERLWLTRTASPPTALAWTPGGGALCIGCESGAVLMVTSETGDTLTHQESTRPVGPADSSSKNGVRHASHPDAPQIPVQKGQAADNIRLGL